MDRRRRHAPTDSCGGGAPLELHRHRAVASNGGDLRVCACSAFRFLGDRRLDCQETTLEEAAPFVEWLQRPASGVIVLFPQAGGHGAGRTAVTVNKITAAMTSFDDYHAANGVGVVDRIVTWRHIARRRYKPFLHHVSKGQPVRRSRLRARQPGCSPRRSPPPTLRRLLRQRRLAPPRHPRPQPDPLDRHPRRRRPRPR